MTKRFFTVKEANDLLPFLTDRLQHLCATYKELESGREERTPPLQDLFNSGGMPVDKQIEDSADSLSFLVWQLGM